MDYHRLRHNVLRRMGANLASSLGFYVGMAAAKLGFRRSAAPRLAMRDLQAKVSYRQSGLRE